jgi:hypothetical protein
MIGALITLLIYVICLAVIWWLANYILDNFPLPDPAGRIIRVAIVVILVLAAIYVLLGVFGVGGAWDVPRLRFGGRDSLG